MKALFLVTALMASTSAETITYHATACLGSCPVYTVTVSSDGQARYDGEGYVAVSGERAFRVTAAQFNAFRERLAPYRPKQGQEMLVTAGTALCPQAATDAPSIEISWASDGHPGEHLVYYGGCLNPKVPHEMWGSLVHAIDALPMAEFLGSKDRR